MATLPALLKTYSSRRDVPYASSATVLAMGQSLLFALKQHLLNNIATGTLSGTRNANSIWTVRYSCDGTTAGTAGDGVDRWAASTNVVFANSGTAHSWFVLRNSTLGYEICIDANNSAGTSSRIAVTEVATPFSGGTTTTGPTSTQDFVLGGTTTNTAATAVTHQTDATTAGTNYTHFVTADDGQFILLANRATTGIFQTCMGVLKTVNNRGGDTRNVFGVLHTVATVRGAPNIAQAGAGAFLTGRNPNGTFNANNVGISQLNSFGLGTYAGTSGLDALSLTYIAFRCQVMSTSGQVVYRGELPDWYTLGTASVGTSVPSAAAQERLVVGDFIVPFPGGPPTL